MHLRDARRAQRLLIDGLEDLVPAAVVLLLDDLEDDGKRQRLRAGLQLHELIAVLRRQEVRPHAHDLAELDKCRAEVLEDLAELDWRHAAHDFALAQDTDHLAQAPGRACILYRILQEFIEHASSPTLIPTSSYFLYFSWSCWRTVSFARKSSYVERRSTTPSGVMSIMRLAIV